MTKPLFSQCDDLGPKSIHHFYEPALGLKAILVVDNIAAGPAIGGIRMGEDSTLAECLRLARAMSLKNAAAGLAHGGAKAVIIADSHTDADRKQELIRALATAIGPITDYIAGPDIGTDETAMAWIKDEIGRSVGLPRVLGGIPLDEIGATGFGLAVAADVAKDYVGLELKGARVAIQGFGAVGKNAARFLSERGAVIIAVADSRGTVYDENGLDLNKLIEIKEAGGTVKDLPGSSKKDSDGIVSIACDIWIPAAQPDVIRKDNVKSVKARLIVQGANIGITEEAETVLHKKGTLCVPDFISNAGGVICAAVEYHGGSEKQAFQAIEEKIRYNTKEVLERAKKAKALPRRTASELAEERIRKAMSMRRWSSNSRLTVSV